MYKIHSIITKTPLFFRVVSLYAVPLLIVLSLFQVFNPKLNTVSLSLPTAYHKEVKSTQVVEKVIFNGEPLSISIERLGIDLPIKNGVFNEETKDWTLSDDAVYYAQITALPNSQNGITFLYGHNNDKVLSATENLVVGDIAVIKTKNDHIFKYIYKNDALVPPDLTSILYEASDTPRLVIMTCEGIWSQARRLMYFDLLESS